MAIAVLPRGPEPAIVGTKPRRCWRNGLLAASAVYSSVDLATPVTDPVQTITFAFAIELLSRRITAAVGAGAERPVRAANLQFDAEEPYAGIVWLGHELTLTHQLATFGFNCFALAMSASPPTESPLARFAKPRLWKANA
jgi:hypothetical protein